MVIKDKSNKSLIVDEGYKLFPKASEVIPYWEFIGYKDVSNINTNIVEQNWRSLTMTNKEALEILYNTRTVAYHNDDGLYCDAYDEDAHELLLALDKVVPMLEKAINKEKIELTKKSDVRKLLIEDFERNSFNELYSKDKYFLMNTKIRWIIFCLYDDEKISKKTTLSLIYEVLEGKL